MIKIGLVKYISNGYITTNIAVHLSKRCEVLIWIGILKFWMNWNSLYFYEVSKWFACDTRRFMFDHARLASIIYIYSICKGLPATIVSFCSSYIIHYLLLCTCNGWNEEEMKKNEECSRKKHVQNLK